MGGEPTLHPDFLGIADHAIAMFDKVTLFTNGSNLHQIIHPDILAAHWTGKFQFIINGYTFDEFKWRSARKYFKKVQLHFVISNSPGETIKKLKSAAALINREQVHFIISGDTQINILRPKMMIKYRKAYMEGILDIIPHLRGAGFSYNFDHTFPSCFWTQEMIEELHNNDIGPVHLQRKSCCDTIIGLLDTNFDLWYCNQTRLKIGNAFVNKSPRSIEEIHRMIRDMPAVKQRSLPEKCQRCPAITTCKSACWYMHTQGD